MGAPYSDIMRKCEDVVEELINRLKANLIEGVALFKGFSLAELSASRIEIQALSAVPERAEGILPNGSYFTGNFNVTMRIAVIGNKGNVTRGSFAKWCAAVEDILMRADAEEQIGEGSITDFTIFKPGWIPGQVKRLTNGSEIMNEYDHEIYCAPSTTNE